MSQGRNSRAFQRAAATWCFSSRRPRLRPSQPVLAAPFWAVMGRLAQNSREQLDLLGFEGIRYSLEQSRSQSGRARKPRGGCQPEPSPMPAEPQPNPSPTLAKEEVKEDTGIPPYSPPTGTGSDDSPNHDDPDDDGFDAAWDAYPKHTGSKTKTRRIWQRTLADTDAERLRSSVDAYAAHTAANRDDARWTPTMANWLERGQWRDWQPKPKDVALPSDYWFANHFDARLLDAGIDYLTVMRLHPDVNQRIRDGDDWHTAADTVIGQTLNNAIQTREEHA